MENILYSEQLKQSLKKETVLQEKEKPNIFKDKTPIKINEVKFDEPPISFMEQLGNRTCIYCGAPLIPNQHKCNYCGCFYEKFNEKIFNDFKKTGIENLLDLTNDASICSMNFIDHMNQHDICYKGIVVPFMKIDNLECEIVYRNENRILSNLLRSYFGNQDYLTDPKRNFLFKYNDRKVLFKDAYIQSNRTNYDFTSIMTIIPQQIIFDE